MKKLLFIAFLFSTLFSIAQQLETNTVDANKNGISSITAISAYPNPLSVETKISFQISKTQPIEFTVKNLLGKIVYTERFNANKGVNSIVFKRNNLAKGMYIYTLQTENEVVSKRMVIK